MSDEQSMSVKAFLDGGKDRQEVRRFGMPENLATNFSSLKEKVCNIFNIASQDIIITWKDCEGDSIVISSDEELVEAIADSLSKQKMQVFRIYVCFKPNDGGQGPSSGTQGNQQGDIHEGVICDVCDKTVVGFRYNCVTCQDFDLCGACETKGMHRDHKMIRMPKPPSQSEPKFWWKEFEGPGGHFATHFGMQTGAANASDGNTFSYSSSSAGPSGPGGQAGGWCGWGPWMGRGGRHCGRNGGRGHGWRGWWGKNWGGARGNGGCWQGQGQTVGGNSSQQQQNQQEQCQGKAQESQQQQQQQQQQQEQNSFGNENGCPFNNPNGPCPFPGMPDPERVAENVQYAAQEAQKIAAQEAQKMAHHVAHHFATQMATDQVANVMKGIWTAWAGQQPPENARPVSAPSSSSSSSTSSDNQENSKGSQTRNATNGTNQDSQEEYLRNIGENVASMLEPMGIDVDVSVEHNGIRQRCSLSDNDLQSRQSPVSKTPNAATPPPQSTDAQPSASSSANIEVQSDQPENNPSPSEMEVSSPPAAEVHMESDVEDWTLVNRDSNSPEGRAKSGTKPKPQTADARVQYPSLLELQTHPDPNIQRALEQMHSMGYNNEGGWLANLLEMKQGDINQVLDMLQPVGK